MRQTCVRDIRPPERGGMCSGCSTRSAFLCRRSAAGLLMLMPCFYLAPSSEAFEEERKCANPKSSCSRVPCSVFRVPCSPSVFPSPCSVFRVPCSAFLRFLGQARPRRPRAAPPRHHHYCGCRAADRRAQRRGRARRLLHRLLRLILLLDVRQPPLCLLAGAVGKQHRKRVTPGHGRRGDICCRKGCL